jgi:hypothetical protein
MDEIASVLLMASSSPLKLLDAIRLNTGETRRKNRIPLSVVRTSTSRSGKLGETDKASPLRLTCVL